MISAVVSAKVSAQVNSLDTCWQDCLIINSTGKGEMKILHRYLLSASKALSVILILSAGPAWSAETWDMATAYSPKEYITSVSSNASFHKTAHTPLVANALNAICRIKLNLKRYHKTFISMCENRFYNSPSLHHTSALYCNISS